MLNKKQFFFTEKGADFSGDTMLRRKFILNGSVDQIKVHLAFSSTDTRQRNTVLLLLQTENKWADPLWVHDLLESFPTAVCKLISEAEFLVVSYCHLLKCDLMRIMSIILL